MDFFRIIDAESVKPEAGAPAAERIEEGSPRTTTWVASETPDGKTIAGMWEATPGRWRVEYDEWESCTILSGISIVRSSGGAERTVRAGDSFVIEPGFRGTWEVVETTRKVFTVRLP
ncbi:cupin domain-containing protein [Lutibaculum baratangense]|uniref:(S)-ureidoglycine aminohydrolase cupin domain-containing protein n=1 Tax=Lutibaculum baratangense AMV1 TaxID=631454 RepID=V4RCR9_9HYPH|nr:cupin domain-containing protein [Lutibaculum baratangense]ESR23194.1 hypothetical protein N177_3262 [Lutibaculum baratangense AMV1]